MKILIHVSNQLIAEAIRQLLAGSEYDDVVVSGKSPANKAAPDVLLVDSATLSHGLLAEHPEAKVLLVDPGMETEKLCTTLLTYRIHGILSPHTELPLFKKAIKMVSEGQIWIENASVKAILHRGSIASQTHDITGREQEIIECICQGLNNREIAGRLALSPHTVKAHLNRIFRKLNITSRSKLISLAMNHPQSTAV